MREMVYAGCPSVTHVPWCILEMESNGGLREPCSIPLSGVVLPRWPLPGGTCAYGVAHFQWPEMGEGPGMLQKFKLWWLKR